MMTGCHSAKEFDYRGKEYDTLNAISIDNREPYPITRDAWRLGLNREATFGEIPLVMGASEDGSIIRFHIDLYFVGRKSADLKQSTQRTATALAAIEEALGQQGFSVENINAIVNFSTPFDFLPIGNTIGYKAGMPATITGAYIFSQPGAYDVVLQAAEILPKAESENTGAFSDTQPATFETIGSNTN